jgi:hypothetical protein
MDLLRRFNDDIATREAVKQFFIDCIAEEAVRRTFCREDVAHIADAKDLIEKTFQQLAITYGVQKEDRKPTNEAR